MKKHCSNIELDDDMKVIFNNKTCTLSEAINQCTPGNTIEGIHPHQYNKLLKRFEQERKKKFQYSVDDRYGDWRFILFDINNNTHKKKEEYNREQIKINPKVLPE